MADAGTNGTGGVEARQPPSKSARDALLIGAMLSLVTILHLFTSPSLGELHHLYRSLYYLPILYAAWSFGMAGGLLTAFAAGILFGLHAQLSLGGLLGSNIDNAFEIVMYVVVGGLFGRLRDVEERKTSDLRQLSRELSEAYGTLEERTVQLMSIRDYTQSILRSTTSGVITVGPDGSVATANFAAESMLGMTETEMVPKPIPRLFQDDGGLGSDVAKVIDGRLPRTVHDTRLVTRNGKVIHVQASVSRMRDVHGGTIGAVLTIEDVSEMKALTEQLIRADRLAAMGELTAGVAHEVRNPLGIIRASVQLLEESRCDSERIREASTVIKQEIDRLDKVVKALLDFGRPSRPKPVATDVNDVLSDVVLFTRKFASRSNVEIVEDFTPDLPKVMADPDQIKQVAVNLISNAVQSMGNGGRLRVSTSSENGFVGMAFADDGPGIRPENLGKVFDPFYSTRDEGTGLGLTIVHRIVDEHNGHIAVESEPDSGTVFRVSLPVLNAGRTEGRPIGAGPTEESGS